MNKFILNEESTTSTCDGACRAYLGMSLKELIKAVQIDGIDNLIDKANGKSLEVIQNV